MSPRFCILVLDGSTYPRSPKEFKLTIHASKGAWSGMASVPISAVPAEIWEMDGEQAFTHPFILHLAHLAESNMRENIDRALLEARECA